MSNIITPEKFYKVLVDGKSCHGGNLVWSLPTDDQPGDWHSVDGEIVLCQSGLHVTTNPKRWWKDGCTVYEVEVEGNIIRDDSKAKIVVPKARLLRVATSLIIDREWKIVQDESKSSGWSEPVKLSLLKF